MKKQVKQIAILASALLSGQIVRIITKAMPGESLDGYVVSLSETFVLLHILDNGNYTSLNGYVALPIGGLKIVRVQDDYMAFSERAMKVKGISPLPQPDILLLDLPGLLSSADAHFPLVTIHQERVDRGCCFIGRVEKLTKRFVHLRKIDPAAHWVETEKLLFEDITRVDFGGGYEEALWLVNQNERAATTQGTEE
jgi:hypothetical protein